MKHKILMFVSAFLMTSSISLLATNMNVMASVSSIEHPGGNAYCWYSPYNPPCDTGGQNVCYGVHPHQIAMIIDNSPA